VLNSRYIDPTQCVLVSAFVACSAAASV
jgi:hypothetical protein